MKTRKHNFFVIFVFIYTITAAYGLAQNNVIKWSGFNMGFESTSASNTKIMSAIGQSFIGQTKGSNNIIESGFLVDSLFFNYITGIKDNKGPTLPSSYELSQNYPNPFNPTTTIQYALPVQLYVRLVVYNTIGQQVEIIVNKQEDPGYHKVVFSGSNLASGIYFYRLQAGDYIKTKKLILLK